MYHAASVLQKYRLINTQKCTASTKGIEKNANARNVNTLLPWFRRMKKKKPSSDSHKLHVDSRSFFMQQTLFERKSIVCLATQWVHSIELTPHTFVCGLTFIIYLKKQIFVAQLVHNAIWFGHTERLIRNRLRCVVFVRCPYRTDCFKSAKVKRHGQY